MKRTREQSASTGAAQRIAAPAVMPARVRRAKHLKPELAQHSLLGRELARLSQRELARALDVQQPFVARCEIEDEPHAPTLLHVASAAQRAPEWGAAMLHWLAGKLRHQAVPAADIVHGDDHAARLASITTELTDVPRAFADALRDKLWTPAELEALLVHAREAVSVLLELERWATVELERQRAQGGS